MQELRSAFRTLRATPTVSLVAIVSLALGIGVNSAAFSLVHALTLRELPVDAPQQLVSLSAGAAPDEQWPFGLWDQIKQQPEIGAAAMAWSRGQFVRQSDVASAPIDVVFASGGFFPVLGARLAAGNAIRVDDDLPNAAPRAVISHRFWQQQLGGAADVIGTSIRIENLPVEIVGVTSPEFFGPDVGRTFDAIVPLALEARLRGPDSMAGSQNRWLRVWFRLDPAVSLAAATARIRALQPQVVAAATASAPPPLRAALMKEPFTLVSAATGSSPLRLQYQRPLVVVFGLVAIVLLVACANVANLLLARTAARRQEIAVRLALGVSRWRLVRQFLTESLVLAVLGGATALLVGVWASRALLTQISSSINPVDMDVSLNWPVVAFTAAVALLTALLCGVGPAWHAARFDPNEALKDQTRGMTSRSPFSSVAVAIQIALSFVLIVGAGLFVRTFERLTDVPLGFDSDRILVATINTTRTPVAPPDRAGLFGRLVAAAAAVPGVQHAAASLETPLGNGFLRVNASLPDGQSLSPADRGCLVNFVGPGWFATYGMTLREGRDVAPSDTTGTGAVMVINDAFRRRFLSQGPAVGATVNLAIGPAGEMPIGSPVIIGVVSDALYRSVREPVAPTIFMPLTQYPAGPLGARITISMRTSIASPASLAPSAAAALEQTASGLKMTFRPLDEYVETAIARERILAVLGGVFGVLAITLAAMGLYGIAAYAVSRRNQEIGIRLALGASIGSVTRLVLVRLSLILTGGLLIGVGASLWLSTAVRSLLYGIEAHDAVTFVAAVVIVTVVAALAAWLPARIAIRRDLTTILKTT